MSAIEVGHFIPQFQVVLLFDHAFPCFDEDGAVPWGCVFHKKTIGGNAMFLAAKGNTSDWLRDDLGRITCHLLVCNAKVGTATRQ